LNRPEEVEQYFLVYGFYRYTEQEIQRSKDRMRRRRKIYSTLAARRKTTYRVKNLHSKNELGLIIYKSKHKQNGPRHDYKIYKKIILSQKMY
jgi:hypothetical protein